MIDYLKINKDESLFCVFEKVSKAKGVVIFCHGFTNHSGDYEAFARKFREAQMSVYRYDMRGHGRSKTPLGDLENIQLYIDDLMTVVRIARRENPNAPIFTLGFSMGGLVSALFGMRYPSMLSGQVFVGPAVGYVPAMTPTTRAMIQAAARISPDLLMHFKDDSIEFVKSKKKEDLEYQYFHTSRNPFRIEYFTVRFVKSVFIDGTSQCLKEMDKYLYPCFVVHGTEDRTVSSEVSTHFIDTIGSKDRSMRMYEGMGHVLFDEPNGDKVMTDCLEWIQERSLK